MVSVDAGVLALLLFPGSSVPFDFKTGKPIDRAKERIDQFVLDLEKSGDVLMIPAPALCEVLVCAQDPNRYIKILQERACFIIKPFAERAATEIAIRTRAALSAKDKKEGVASPWQKVKYDRQIIAISKVEGASALYALDEDIHKHARLWGLSILSISDIPIPAVQTTMFPLPAALQNVRGSEESVATQPVKPHDAKSAPEE